MVSPCNVSVAGCLAVSGGSGRVTPLPPRTCPAPGEGVRCTVRTLLVVPFAGFASSPPCRLATCPRCEDDCCSCCCDCAMPATPTNEQPRTPAHTATRSPIQPSLCQYRADTWL